MKFFIDENLPNGLSAALSAMFATHRFRSHAQEHTDGWEDVPLINELHMRGFDAIITLDGQQLVNFDERDALQKCGIDWIGLSSGALASWGASFQAVATVSAGSAVAYYEQLGHTAPTALYAPHPGDPAKPPKTELL